MGLLSYDWSSCNDIRKNEVYNSTGSVFSSGIYIYPGSNKNVSEDRAVKIQTESMYGGGKQQSSCEQYCFLTTAYLELPSNLREITRSENLRFTETTVEYTFIILQTIKFYPAICTITKTGFISTKPVRILFPVMISLEMTS